MIDKTKKEPTTLQGKVTTKYSYNYEHDYMVVRVELQSLIRETINFFIVGDEPDQSANRIKKYVAQLDDAGHIQAIEVQSVMRYKVKTALLNYLNSVPDKVKVVLLQFFDSKVDSVYYATFQAKSECEDFRSYLTGFIEHAIRSYADMNVTFEYDFEVQL